MATEGLTPSCLERRNALIASAIAESRALIDGDPEVSTPSMAAMSAGDQHTREQPNRFQWTAAAEAPVSPVHAGPNKSGRNGERHPWLSFPGGRAARCCERPDVFEGHDFASYAWRASDHQGAIASCRFSSYITRRRPSGWRAA